MQDKEISRGVLIRLLFVSIAILLLGAAIAIFIFSRGNSGNILATVATTLSVVAALLQWLLPLSTKPSSSSDQAYSLFLKQVEPKPLAEEGTAVIYTSSKLRNKQVEILDLQTQ